MKGTHDFLALFKNNERKSFFQLQVRSTRLKLKKNRNHYVYEGVRPFSISRISRYGLCDTGVILKELEHNSNLSVKSQVLTRGQTSSYT